MHESGIIVWLIKFTEASEVIFINRNKNISLILFGPILYKHL